MLDQNSRLLVVDDDRTFADNLRVDGERLGLQVETLYEPHAFEAVVTSWQPAIIAMDLVMPEADGLDLLHRCARLSYSGKLILMSAGFELYLKMANEIAATKGLYVVGVLEKPFRPKQFSYLLMSLM